MSDKENIDEFTDGEFSLAKLDSKEIEDKKKEAVKEDLRNLKNIGVYNAWELVKDELRKKGLDENEAEEISKGKGVNIAIINSGVDYNHPEIKERFRCPKGYNFLDKNDNPTDKIGHGTAVAGIVAGKTMGVAPKSNLYALKIKDKGITSTTKDIAKAIKWCIENEYKIDIDIVNICVGNSIYNENLEEICKEAHKNGIILTAVAGNIGVGQYFPASYEGVISIAAVNEDNLHCRFSNMWSTVDISAPGINVFTLCLKEETDKNYETAYKKSRGTSIATPHVTGVIALAIAYLKNQRIDYDAEKLEKLMKEHTTKISSENGELIRVIEKKIKQYHLEEDLSIDRAMKWAYGEGIINADSFLKAFLQEN